MEIQGQYDPNQIMFGRDGFGRPLNEGRLNETRIKKFFLNERNQMSRMKKLQICPTDVCCQQNLYKYFVRKKRRKKKKMKSSLTNEEYYKLMLQNSPQNLEDLNVGNMKISYKKYLINPFAPNKKCNLSSSAKKKRRKKFLNTICAKMKQFQCSKDCKAKVGTTSKNSKVPCFFTLQGLYENYNMYKQNYRCGDLCKAGPPRRRKKVRKWCCGVPGLYPVRKDQLTNRLNICSLKPLLVKPKKNLTYHEKCFSPSTRIIKKISYVEDSGNSGKMYVPCGHEENDGYYMPRPKKVFKLPKGVLDLGQKKGKCGFLEVFNFYVNQKKKQKNYGNKYHGCCYN